MLCYNSPLFRFRDCPFSRWSENRNITFSFDSSNRLLVVSTEEKQRAHIIIKPIYVPRFSKLALYFEPYKMCGFERYRFVVLNGSTNYVGCENSIRGGHARVRIVRPAGVEIEHTCHSGFFFSFFFLLDFTVTSRNYSYNILLRPKLVRILSKIHIFTAVSYNNIKTDFD